jgi:hypothetical protein
MKDLINHRFGLLLVIDELDRVRKPCGKPVRVFLCKCECGNEKSIRMSDLTSGKTISCGCRVRKHGKRNSRAYVIWRGMKARCLNPKATCYNNYGGAGVTIDERWLEFKNFYEDMGDPPDGMTLDKDSIVRGNKIYGPGLCKWSTPAEQSVNRTVSIGKKSKYVYVSWNTAYNRWQVIIKNKNFETFHCEKDAVLFVCNQLNVELNDILRENWISSKYHFENRHTIT